MFVRENPRLSNPGSGNITIIPLKPNSNYVLHLLSESVTMHSVFMGFV
jgi:hypothetical protein